MRRLPTLLALGIATLLAACSYPTEVGVPISAPGSASLDERLLGSWYLVSGGPPEGGMLTVVRGEDGRLDIVGIWTETAMLPGGADAAGGPRLRLESAWIRWAAHASTIDGETWFNARIVDHGAMSQETGKPPASRIDGHFVPQPDRGYWIARARLRPDGLLALDVLWGEDGLQALGLPRREVRCGADCSFTLFDPSAAQLVAAIRGGLPTEGFVLAPVGEVYPPQP